MGTAPPPGTNAVKAAKVREGKIARSDLISVLDAGPGAFLRDLDVVAVTENDKFTGWKIAQIVGDSSPTSRADLQVGDIIRAVNQQTLARPDQLMELWQALRTASALQVAVERGRENLLLSFAIID